MILWTVACQDPLCMGFSRLEYGSELPCPSPGDISDPGIKPASPAPPALQADSLPLSHGGNPYSGIPHFTVFRRYCSFVFLFSFFFYKLKVFSKSIDTIFSIAFAHFVSPGHALVILIIFQMFSFSLYLLW